ncbi:MAG: BamA/TamA family outer membrane protein [Myxococcales bacterium]|nr:BamA/TamA family outer membrane protein [Myxococcales bacterium]
MIPARARRGRGQGRYTAAIVAPLHAPALALLRALLLAAPAGAEGPVDADAGAAALGGPVVIPVARPGDQSLPIEVLPDPHAIPPVAAPPPLPQTVDEEYPEEPEPPAPEVHPEIRERRPRTTTRRHLILPLPTVRTEPLVGLMIGVRLTYAYRPLPDAPNRAFLAVESRVSLRRVHNHGFGLVLYDWLGHKEVFDLGVNVHLDPVFPYYGLDPREGLDRRELEDRYYLNHVNTYTAYLGYQHPIWRYEPESPGRVAGALRGLVGVAYAIDTVDAAPDSLLAAQRPDALGITRRGTLRGGFVWDRRDNEYSPRWGGLHSAIVDVAGPWTGSSTGTWARVNLAARWYRRLFTRDFVLASQAIYDGLFGDVPLVPLGRIGGLHNTDAIGGRDIGRGFYRRRFIGRHKMIFSMELRFEPVEVRLGRHLVGGGFKLFADIGRVIHPSERLFDNTHVSGGPGAYVAVDRFTVIRIDAGFSPETVGFYVTGEHTF